LTVYKASAVVFVAMCLALVGPVASAADSAADMLAVVPDEAVVVAGVGSLADFEADLGAFAGVVMPEVAPMVIKGYKDIYTLETGIEDGINTSLPMVLFLVLPSTDPDDEVGMEAEPALIGAIALSDESAWRAAMADLIGKDEEGREYVRGDFGPESYFAVRNGVLVVAKSGESFDRWTATSRAPLSAERAQSLAAMFAAAKGLVVDVSVARLHELYLDVFDKMIAEMRNNSPFGPDAPQMAAITSYIRFIDGLYGELLGARIEAVLGADGLRLSCTESVAENGDLHKMFAMQQPADLSVLKTLPAGDIGSGVFNVDPGPMLVEIKTLLGDMMSAMGEVVAEESGAEAGDTTAIADEIDNALDDMMKYELFKNVALSYKSFGGEKGVEFAASYSATDPEGALDAMMNISKSICQNPMMMQINSASGLGEPEFGTETISGVEVQTYRQSLISAEMNPMQTAFMNAMYGGELVGRCAVKDSRLYAVLANGPELMQSVLTESVTPIDETKMLASLKDVGEGASVVGFVSLPDMIVQVFSMIMMQKMSPAGGGGGFSLTAPTTTRFATGAVFFKDNTVTMELVLPAEQINAAKLLGTQAFMMAQMAAQVGPSGQMGPSGPQWSAPQEVSGTDRLDEIGFAIAMYQVDNDEKLPATLQVLLDKEYMSDAMLVADPTGAGEFDAARIDETGFFTYVPLKDASGLSNPGEVPIAWEKVSGRETPGGVRVLMAGLNTELISVERLQKLVEANKSLYEKTPELPK
jgi:hypothetical protein